MSRYHRPFRGSQQFVRPENALKRAEELIGVGQKQAALQTLHDTLTTGKRTRQWSATFETIMFRHIDLCCEMRKGRKAKEALQQYRNMCQQANVASLEEVIKHFMKRAGEKAEEAQSKADAAVALNIGDLEVDATPEDIMLSYVSGEKAKDRTDRTFVTPWFRFLWETYRNLLDILRHNSRLEALYALTIHRTFEFCFKYKRQSEFRRLCELLRSHLTNIQRRALFGKDQRDRPDLTNPDTLQLHVDTRFEQLKVACKLELWQEAFRSVEDIINLVAINVKIIKPGMMEAYYARLTEVFAFSDESILHCGYAWYKLFNLARNYNKSLVPADQQMLASNVLLTALSVRPYPRGPLRPGNERSDQTRERQKRLANILGFGLDSKYQNEESYSRDALLTELSRKQFLNLVPVEIQQLYRLLERDFKPLELCKIADTLLTSIEQLPKTVSAHCPIQEIDFTRYTKRLQHAAVLKMLKNMSRVYVNMKTSNLAACVPFMTFGEVEATIVDAVKNNYLQVRIDHKDGMIHFGGDTLDSESFHVHISRMAERLCTSLKMMHPGETPERRERVADAINRAREKVHNEHTFALARKDLIERRKEEQEQVLLEKERAEERKKREQLEQVQAAEKQRRRQEAARREEDRIKREIEEKEMEEAKAMLGNKKLKEGEKLDKKRIMHNVLTEKLKEQQELDRRLQKLAKQMDHLERAKREEEYPFIEDFHAKFLVSDREFYEEQKQKTLESKRKTWEIDSAEKKRLSKMGNDKEEFESQVRARRKEEFEELRIAHERRREERRRQRKLDRLNQRRKAFIDECRTQIDKKIHEEEAAQKEAEEERRLEEKRRRLEEKDKELAAQKEREDEMERKKVEGINKILNNAGGGGADGGRWGGGRPVRENKWSSVGSDKDIQGGVPPPLPLASASPGGYVPPHLRGRGGPPEPSPGDGRWGQRPQPSPRRPQPSPRRPQPSPRRPSPRRDQRSPARSPRRQSRSPYRGRPDDRPRSPRDRPSGPRGNADADRWERKSSPQPRSPPRPRPGDSSWVSDRPKASPRPRDEGDRWERGGPPPPPPQDQGRWVRPAERAPVAASQQPDDEGWQVKGRSPNRQRGGGERWERSGPPARSPPRDRFRSPNVSPRRHTRGPSPRRDPPIRSGGGYVPPGARQSAQDQGRGPGGDFPPRRDDWRGGGGGGDDRRDRPGDRYVPPSRDQPPRDGPPPREADRGGSGAYVPPSRRNHTSGGQSSSERGRW